jgi:hypothetical protein
MVIALSLLLKGPGHNPGARISLCARIASRDWKLGLPDANINSFEARRRKWTPIQKQYSSTWVKDVAGFAARAAR